MKRLDLGGAIVKLFAPEEVIETFHQAEKDGWYQFVTYQYGTYTDLGRYGGDEKPLIVKTIWADYEGEPRFVRQINLSKEFKHSDYDVLGRRFNISREEMKKQIGDRERTPAEVVELYSAAFEAEAAKWAKDQEPKNSGFSAEYMEALRNGTLENEDW
jgi:hypothetical protein